MSQINNIVKVQISKFLGYKLPPIPEDESIEDIDKYKIYDFDFTKGKLPDGVEFYRLSKDWDWDGNEYDIDQPILYEDGLWNWGERTNHLLNTDLLQYGVSRGVRVVPYRDDPLLSATMYMDENSGLVEYLRAPSTPAEDRWGLRCYSIYAKKPVGFNPPVIAMQSRIDGAVGVVRMFLHFNGVQTPPSARGDQTIVDWGRDYIHDGIYRFWFSARADGENGIDSFFYIRANFRLTEETPIAHLGMPQIEYGVTRPSPTIPTEGSIKTVSKTTAQSNIILRKDFTLGGRVDLCGDIVNYNQYLFTLGREDQPERYIGLKLNRLTNKLQLDSSVGVSKESVKTYKAGDVIKFAVVRRRDRFGVVINGEEFLEINFKVNFLNSDLNKLFFGNYFDSDEHILPSYIKHFAIYDKPFNTNTLIHMTEVEDGDS